MTEKLIKDLHLKKTSIRYTQSNGPQYTWRPNPKDPFIYVTFNKDQVLGMVPSLKKSLLGVSDISPDMVEEYIKIIKATFINKAQLPIRFLSGKESIKELESKNVVYFSSMNLTKAELKKLNGKVAETTEYHTKTLMDNCGKMQCVAQRFIRIPKIDKMDFTKIDRRAIKHEMLHAFADFKHATSHAESDIGPFNEDLTCEESLMTYEDKCPPVQKVYKAYHSYGSQEKFVEAVYKAYPTELGKVDLEALDDFKKEWNEKNSLPIHNQTKSSESILSDKSELMIYESPENIYQNFAKTSSDNSLLQLGLFALSKLGLYQYPHTQTQIETTKNEVQEN